MGDLFFRVWLSSVMAIPRVTMAVDVAQLKHSQCSIVYIYIRAYLYIYIYIYIDIVLSAQVLNHKH